MDLCLIKYRNILYLKSIIIFFKSDASIKSFNFACSGISFNKSVGYYNLHNTSVDIVPISIFSPDMIIPAVNGSYCICPIFTWFNYSNIARIYLYLIQSDNINCEIGYFNIYVYYISKID